MARGCPIYYGSKMSKPIKPELKTEKFQLKPKKNIKVKCSHCSELQKTIEFERKLIIILSAGLIFKMILDSLLLNRR